MKQKRQSWRTPIFAIIIKHFPNVLMTEIIGM